MSSHRSRLARLAGYLVLVLVALAYTYPFLIELGTAFKTNADATAHPLNPLPQQWSLDAFDALAELDFPRWAANSLVVTVAVTVGRIVSCSMAGYALARLRFRGRSAVFGALIAVMAVPGVVLLIPKFLVLNQLGVYDTYAAMILPLLVDATGIFIMKQFFETVPVSVEEAARIDGAGPFRTFWSVVLPMSKPALITLTILSFQASWNELPHFIVSRQDPALNTLTTGVATLVSGQLGQGNQFPLKLAAALLMTLPVAVVYFIFSSRFTRGTYEGADK
ncbi:carbohydrate ABC transporter permease [Goodfellowiella coeruleoviolacea]|uniref:Multiple sugar transport system permease protein n=1 Tax=Goodfellowiella coeruleoviolacea TaxID=334858 RepID=A0AAE3GFS6_9PSEU|nr:carbohydrate ABC transporter permease [Goodfellowiella coeruleoviolacea]MCP2167401.1 multiple sugar transport system permease protein [Goodfellowiella coeruleoviolacea]